MKQLLMVFLGVVLCLTNVSAQNSDEKILTKKWKMNTELMRSVIEQMLAKRPEMADLDETNKQVAINTALEQIANNTIEYRKNGSLEVASSKGKATGKWIYDQKEKTIVHQLDGKEEKRYFILELNDAKLHLKTKEGQELIFKAN